MPEPQARVLPRRPADKIVERGEAARLSAEARGRGQTVVFANGCFDILHGGHVSYLNEARALGDLLIVGINSDRSERELKGPDRPIMGADERAELIAGMEAVDGVFVFDELTADASLREVRPSIHAKGTDYTAESVPERAVAEELGIQVCITGDPKQNASKQIMRKIRESGPG